jgi:formylglycine-generating enzyme required for sulfatase activity
MGCENPSSGGNDSSIDDGPGIDPDDEDTGLLATPSLTGLKLILPPVTLRTSGAVKGATVATLSCLESGTAPFTYSLVHCNEGHSVDNDRFAVNGNKITIDDEKLNAGTYRIKINVVDAEGAKCYEAKTITIYSDAVAKERESRSAKNIDFAMRYIPKGRFESTDDSHGMPEKITCQISSGYWMGETEVTQELFEDVMGYNPSYYNRNPSPGEAQGKRPVEQITFPEAIVFCNRLSELQGREPVYQVWGVSDWTAYPNWAIPTLATTYVNISVTANGYRVPTINEWKWAAMGADVVNPGMLNTTGEKKPYAGAVKATLDQDIEDYVWLQENSGFTTHEVGLKRPNELGLFDMNGNALEYVQETNRGDPQAMGENSSTNYANGYYYLRVHMVSQPPYNEHCVGLRIVSNW